MPTNGYNLRVILVFTALLGVLLGGGCSEEENRTSLYDVNRELTAQNQELELQVEQLSAENESLRSRVNALTGLEGQRDAETLATVKTISIAKKSGIIDRDRDGEKETLVVYLHTRDGSGDGIKSTGRLRVALWDLGQPQNRALVEEWELGPEELKSKWTSGMLGSFYRLHFPVKDYMGELGDELTVKAEFLDYLTGEQFETQTVVKR